MAGAVGLEPTPSSLTVRCPADWTTPHSDELSNLHDSRPNGNALRTHFSRGNIAVLAKNRWQTQKSTIFIAGGNFQIRQAKKVGGRKPAQPSIPEGTLGFLPPDVLICRKRSATPKFLKTRSIASGQPSKKVPGASKFFEANRLKVTRQMPAHKQDSGRQRAILGDDLKEPKGGETTDLRPSISHWPTRTAPGPAHLSPSLCSGNGRTQ